MEKIAILNEKNADFSAEFAKILARGAMDIESVEPKVKELLSDIKKRGVAAVCEHIARFDGWEPREFSEICIKESECEKAYNNLNNELKIALKTAFSRIWKFHEKQKPKSWLDFEENGSILGQKATPVDRAGLYIPGGKAAYPSSLLMNATPALVAGVREIVVCTPAPQNELNPLLLAALHLCEIKEAYKIGGASAIGAMAYGLKSKDENILAAKKVDVISGPGNIFVATAKKLVFGEVGIDMIAGPSEIGIIAQSAENAPSARLLAADLLSQAEHDEMASSILITPDENLANAVSAEISALLPNLTRSEIATKSITKRGAIIVSKSLESAISLMNEIAPEHLELLVRDPLLILPKIRHAGAIFIGEQTPEPIGDYIAGPNHTLPTGGSARFFSPLSTEIFMKKSSIINFSRAAMKELGEQCANLAKAEGLTAHELSVRLRLEK